MNKINPSIPILSNPICLEEGVASNDIIFPSLPWSSLSVGTREPCLRSSPGISSVPGAFPAFSFLTAATISERRMTGSLQWLGPKVGALRQEESMVG